MHTGHKRGGPDKGPREGEDPAFEPASTGDLIISDAGEALLVEMLSDGRLRAPKERTREILRERLSKAEVLPTGPGWAVLRPFGASPPSSSRARAEQEREVVMVGALGEASLALIDIMGFLASGLQTGVLSVHTDGVERSVYLLRGDVVWTSSSSSADRIGEFLVRRGKITPAQLAQATAAAPGHVGRACVERGFIAAHDLWRMVQENLRDIFEKVLAAERGMWSFGRIAEDQLGGSGVILPTQGLLLDAMRKLDEMKLYRDLIRSTATLIRRLPAPADAEGRLGRLEPHEKAQILALHAQLPASATVQDIMRSTGRGEYDVTRTLVHLARARLIEVLEDELSPLAGRAGAGIKKHEAHDLAVIYAMAIKEIYGEAERTGHREALHISVRGFLNHPPEKHVPVLRTVHLGHDGAVDAAGIAEAIEKLPLTRGDLVDAFTELLFFALFEVSSVLAQKQRDDLARRVKMIQNMVAAQGASR
ncbi:MAG: DUF4388 domain-containing protein [Myxococcota bacterium]